MSDFGHISREEHEEWLRHPATVGALADLREQGGLANETTVVSASSASIDQVRYNAGFAAGLNYAVHYLTKERK